MSRADRQALFAYARAVHEVGRTPRSVFTDDLADLLDRLDVRALQAIVDGFEHLDRPQLDTAVGEACELERTLAARVLTKRFKAAK